MQLRKTNDHIELRPIKTSAKEFEQIERKIIDLFKAEIYYPILAIIKAPAKVLKLKNATSSLAEALESGQVVYSDGHFAGKFTAAISAELRGLGAKWKGSDGTYILPLEDIPPVIKISIGVSQARFQEKIEQIDKKLSTISPDRMVEKLVIAAQFAGALHKTERQMSLNIGAVEVEIPTRRDGNPLVVHHELDAAQREKIAVEWESNMKLWVKDFTEEQIRDLRRKVWDNVEKGGRFEALIGDIQESYGVSANKAKFLARQETNLLMAKYQETRYVAAGITHYKWGCVKMPHEPSPTAPYIRGDVRWSHGILEGHIYAFADPPITTAPVSRSGKAIPQRRNNPQQDYNCRCFAIPVIQLPSNYYNTPTIKIT